MASLIENILSIENQANEIVAKAHAESKALEKGALAEIQRVRQEIDAQTEQRIEAFRKDAEQKHQATLAAEKEEAARRLAGSIGWIPRLSRNWPAPLSRNSASNSVWLSTK